MNSADDIVAKTHGTWDGEAGTGGFDGKSRAAFGEEVFLGVTVEPSKFALAIRFSGVEEAVMNDCSGYVEEVASAMGPVRLRVVKFRQPYS